MKFMNAEPPLPLREGESSEDRETIDRVLERYWAGKEAWKKNAKEEDKHFTYGEVTVTGVRQLIQLLELKGLGEDVTADDPIIFYDLGSGAGKIVAQVFLENVTTLAVGVELSENRHLLAETKWESMSQSAQEEFICRRLQRDQYMGRPRVQFQNLDILDADFSDATHLYVSSLCFPPEVTEKVSQIIADNRQQYAKLRVVVALSKLPALENDENRPHWKKHLELIQMTWGYSTAKVYRFVG